MTFYVKNAQHEPHTYPRIFGERFCIILHSPLKIKPGDKMTRQGKSTIVLNEKPSILSHAAVVGKTEGEGPLSAEFDFVFKDDTLGEESFEKSESALQKDALRRALDKAGISEEQADTVIAGDLLNQLTASSFSLRGSEAAYLGVFGACSTMALSLGLAAILTGCGASKFCAAVTSSHFCTAERQFRMPLEYGGQRPQSAQRTVTGAGADILSAHRSDRPCVTAVSFGKIYDLGITDANNMGAAMAPAYVSMDT